MTRSLWLIVLSIAVLLAGCDNTGSVETSRTEEMDRVSEHKRQTVRDSLIRTAQILATVGPNHAAFQSIRKALDLRQRQGYAEDVSFAHLFKKKPQVRAESLRSKYASAGKTFRTAVRESLSKVQATSVSFNENLQQFLVDEGITVAWVQRGEFESMTAAPTITYHPLTRKAHQPNSGVEVPGFKPVDGERGEQYTRVMVDAEYVEKNPTLVVRPCESGRVGRGVNRYCEFLAGTNGNVRIAPPGPGGGGGGGGWGDGGSTGDSEIDSKSLTDDKKFEVYIGDFQCREDTDSFLSGGPEVRIANAEPKVVSTNPVDVEGNTYVIKYDGFSGDECDNNDWESVGSNWTSPWEKGDIRNGLVVWDYDKFTVNGSASFNLTYDGEVNGVEIRSTADVTVEYDNGGTWGKIPYARANFVDNNATDCNSLGKRNGRCIRGVGSYARFTFGANILE